LMRATERPGRAKSSFGTVAHAHRGDERPRIVSAGRFALESYPSQLPMPSRERHIRPLFSQRSDDDRIAVWRDVLAKRSEDQAARR
jgi:hypothetical protein